MSIQLVFFINNYNFLFNCW